MFLSSSSVPTIKHELIVLDVLLVVLRLAGYLINFIGEYLLQSLGPLTLRVLTEKFIDTIHRVKPGEALRKEDLLACFTSDAPYLSELLGGLIPAILIQVIRLGMGAFILYRLSVLLTVLAVALTYTMLYLNLHLSVLLKQLKKNVKLSQYRLSQ